MSDGAWIALGSIWIVFVVFGTWGAITLANYARKKDPKAAQRAARQSMMGARWMGRQFTDGYKQGRNRW